jgi:hypothetical protein
LPRGRRTVVNGAPCDGAGLTAEAGKLMRCASSRRALQMNDGKAEIGRTLLMRRWCRVRSTLRWRNGLRRRATRQSRAALACRVRILRADPMGTGHLRCFVAGSDGNR